MKIYQVGLQQFAIIDNELWVKADFAPEVEQSETKLIKRKRKYKVKEKSSTTARAKTGALSDEVNDEIREKFRNGATRQELMKEYGISYPTVSKYVQRKPMIQRTKNHEAHDFICANGHEFMSKLPPGKAICPTCHSDDCSLGTLNGPVKDL